MVSAMALASLTRAAILTHANFVSQHGFQFHKEGNYVIFNVRSLSHAAIEVKARDYG